MGALVAAVVVALAAVVALAVIVVIVVNFFCLQLVCCLPIACYCVFAFPTCIHGCASKLTKKQEINFTNAT